MSALTWATNHRIWALGVGIVVIIAALAGGVWYLVLRSPGTQLDLRQALRLYRQDERATKAGSQLLPPSGVYQYRTTGGEQLSIAGISRSFPSTTDMIVTDARCATMKWEPLEQHMEGQVVCPQRDGALGITQALSYEQIAGTQDSSVINCPTGTYLVPPRVTVGERWHATCRAAGERMAMTGQIVGWSSVKVGTHQVPALHTRLTFSFSGSESGTNPNDYWVSLHDGLVLRQMETVAVSQPAGPLGSVHYSEQMAITLTSTTPQR